MKTDAMLRAAAGAAGGGGGGDIGTPDSHWDFSDITSLFQVNNGTTVVTADGQHVQYVTDLVGAVDMASASDGTGVLYKANIQNGLGVGRFTNAAGNTYASTFSLPDGFTVIVAGNFAAVAQSRRTLFGGHSHVFGADFSNTSKLNVLTAADHVSSATLDTSWHVYTLIANGASSKMRIDGVGVFSGDIVGVDFNNPAIGNDGAASQLHVGDIGEVALYLEALSAEDLTAAEAYFADKWGL